MTTANTTPTATHTDQLDLVSLEPLQIIVKSKSANHPTYLVQQHLSVLTCTCKGYMFRNTCRHVDEALVLLQTKLDTAVNVLTAQARTLTHDTNYEWREYMVHRLAWGSK